MTLSRLTFAFHNIVIHPLCGLLWLVGASALGDRLHLVGNDG